VRQPIAEPQDIRVTKKIEARFRRQVKAEVKGARPKDAQQPAKAVLASQEKIINQRWQVERAGFYEVRSATIVRRSISAKIEAGRAALGNASGRFSELNDKIYLRFVSTTKPRVYK
jgi:hypothetical protein